MSGYFLYHSIGMFPDKQQRIAAELNRFATAWGREDDGQWGYALEQQCKFLEGWRAILNAGEGSVAQAESVTSALYTILRGLPEATVRGGKVLIAADCFPSLHFLLAETIRRLGGELVTVPAAAGEAWVSDEQMLAAWDGNVRVAILTWVTSTSSHRSDVARLVAHGRQMGTLTGIDVTQGIGIARYDCQAIGADFTIGSSLKWLCGVSGAAVIHATQELIARCTPELRGWFSQQNPFSWDLDAFEFAPDARRFGNGTPSVLPAIGSLPGLDFVRDTGLEALAADNAAKGAELADWIAGSGLRLLSPADAAQRGGSLMVELPDSMDATEVVNSLRAQALHTDARGRVLRLSPGIVTGMEEVTRLTECLSSMLGQKAEV
ncbi:aminotransferase class V-fold PLP-dependent enzyme [Pseudooceanicola sp. HF7]|uniref:aminotransferase class V-fold PLP-dependent enzyme n=1 Tax=Pseudooceanicola sp. HF7 TaxID=2721560 RepID=UPI0014316B15|nr:aminotransferase class V-fold PLP-dependent enzyme [Pseudooceanicola sp. HF7]NIZ11721.1 aminotransferase class V-fold PLP-dependent enzyme [Pseudooceanicola sp. HF7]